MCGRYNIHDDPWLRALLSELGIALPLRSRVNIAPTEPVPVVFEEDGERRVHEMRWWLVPSWAPEVGTKYSMFNARAETLAESRAFRWPFRHRRCILPASSFIEWTTADGHKQPWLIRPREDAIAFAGLWDRWEKDGNCVESCTIVTTAAAPGMERLHTRMPLMLRPEDMARWLDVGPGAPDPAPLLRAAFPTAFVAAPLSAAVSNARHKDENLMTPIGPDTTLDEDHTA